MKPSLSLLVGVIAILAAGGCDNITGLDNREPPGSVLTGRVVFEGEPVGVRSTGVDLELWQPGYELNEKIPVNVAQDGTFQALLFDGTYKLNLLANNGPWVNSPDTLLIELSGATTVDFPVTPYYVVREPAYSRVSPTTDAPGGAVSATFRVGAVDTSRPVEYVGLYINGTAFVDRINSVASAELPAADIQAALDANGTIELHAQLPDAIYETNSPLVREFVNARIGIKTTGVAELIYSPIFQIEL